MAEQFNDSISNTLKKDLETSHEMPVGVQVVARKWEDEVCLGVMTAIAEGIQKP
jgi:Asp-tRNA(Asn)/Glu-tRNA(Gln) amidotransferase A subunit family amidase